MKKATIVEFSELVNHATLLKKIDWNTACKELNVLWNTEDGNCLQEVSLEDFTNLETIEDYGYSEFVCEVVKDFMNKNKKKVITIASVK